MPNYHIPSMSQIKQRAKSAQRQMESRIKSMTNNGRRIPTKQEIEQLGREMARKLRY